MIEILSFGFTCAAVGFFIGVLCGMLWMIRNGADDCIYCANRNECSVDEEPDCLCCLDGSCPCKECISGGSKFALDKKKVQEEMAKEAEE